MTDTDLTYSDLVTALLDLDRDDLASHLLLLVATTSVTANAHALLRVNADADAEPKTPEDQLAALSELAEARMKALRREAREAQARARGEQVAAIRAELAAIDETLADPPASWACGELDGLGARRSALVDALDELIPRPRGAEA